jgi:hypothetical protein
MGGPRAGAHRTESRAVDGLTNAAQDFPAPPVPAEELKAKLGAFHAASAAAVAAETTAREQHAAKDEALEDLVDSLKADLKYAEFAVREEPEKLSRLGWSTRRDGTPLPPPGETRDITIVSEGDTWAILRWKSPGNGGAPAFYLIQRRQEGAPWEDAGTTTNTEQLMSNQPRGLCWCRLAIGDRPPPSFPSFPSFPSKEKQMLEPLINLLVLLSAG